MSFFLNFLYAQLLVSLPYPTTDFAGQTVIVTGANTGLGLEAARHFVRLNAAKVILGVRNLDKGEVARKSIEASTKRIDVVEVWHLDLSTYASVKEFAKRAESLKRLDVVVENAGIGTNIFTLMEENESVITTNVVSPSLLALLILPKLRETATKFNVIPRLVVVASDLHFLTSFPERKSDDIFDTLSYKETANMADRYNVSKILEVFIVRELGNLISASSKAPVIINCLTPGFCHSDFGRDMTGFQRLFFTAMKTLLARTTEVGSRTILAAAAGGQETHGQYMADCRVTSAAPLVLSSEGAEAQKRVWAELSRKLETIQPSVLQNI